MANRGFYIHDIVTVCRNNDVRFSITASQHRSLRDAEPSPYSIRGAGAQPCSLDLPQGWPWANLFSGGLARLRSLPTSI